MSPSLTKTFILLFASLQFSNAYAAKCFFKMRELITLQNTSEVNMSYAVPTLPSNSSIKNFFSSSANNHLIDDAIGIQDFFKKVESALNEGSIDTSYLFTANKWDDQGLSKAFQSSSATKAKMENGQYLYLVKNQKGEMHLYAEIESPVSGVVETHKLGGTKFSKRLNKLEDKGFLSLVKLDSFTVGRTVNVDEFGTKGLVDIANDYISARKELSGWSFTNSDRIDIVKSAYRYMIDLQRSGKIRTKVQTSEYVQKTIDRVKAIHDDSGISAQNATDLVYESLSMNIDTKLMTSIYKHAYKNISGGRYYYMTFLNSMFANIKIRKLKGERIDFNDSSWKAILDEYLEMYRRAEKEAGFWGSEMAPMMFSYSMLKKGDFDENMLYAKELIKVIEKPISSTKISGGILLLAQGMKIDHDIVEVEKLAETIKLIYDKTRHDKGGAVLMGEIALKDNVDVAAMKADYEYLYDNIRLANTSTIGEATYLGRKMGMNFNEIRHAMTELTDRLYSNSSLDSQGVIDLLESLRLKRRIDEFSTNAEDALSEIDEEAVSGTLDDIIEEIADDSLNTIIMLAVVINIAT